MNKIVNIPDDDGINNTKEDSTFQKLSIKAAKADKKLKPYIEDLLIKHAKK